MKDETAEKYIQVSRLLHEIAQNDNENKKFATEMMKKISNKANEERDLNDNEKP